MSEDTQNPALHERVQELEVRFAFVERVHEDLDAVLSEFTQRVQRLESEVRQLKAQLAGVASEDT